MILGRPTNLWLGLVGAVTAFLQVAIVNLVPDVNATAVATVLGAFGLLLAALVSLIANQPPVVNPGDTVHVITAAGQPNYETTIATPPKQDAPPVPVK